MRRKFRERGRSYTGIVLIKLPGESFAGFVFAAMMLKYSTNSNGTY